VRVIISITMSGGLGDRAVERISQIVPASGGDNMHRIPRGRGPLRSRPAREGHMHQEVPPSKRRVPARFAWVRSGSAVMHRFQCRADPNYRNPAMWRLPLWAEYNQLQPWRDYRPGVCASTERWKGYFAEIRASGNRCHWLPDIHSTYKIAQRVAEAGALLPAHQPVQNIGRVRSASGAGG